MRPAVRPVEPRDAVRLLVLDPHAGTWVDLEIDALPEVLRAGDLLVVNDAATLPASLHGRTRAGEEVELRLIGPPEQDCWQAAVLGAGTWRQRTEDRPLPPELFEGDRIDFGGGGLVAEIRGRTPVSARLVELTFDRDGAALWEALYRVGRPVQYSHLEEDLELWSVQTLFAGRPWAAEMPSAGRPLSWRLVQRLRSRGVGLVSITHAAGLSATGDPAIDAALPLPERYEVPSSTVQAIRDTKQMGGRVIAVGTTVTRALEGAAAAHGGRLEPGAGVTDLVLDAHFEPRIVDGLLTGMHEPTESHYRLLEAFVERTVLDSAVAHAIEAGYRTHEFGDCTLVLTE